MCVFEGVELLGVCLSLGVGLGVWDGFGGFLVSVGVSMLGCGLGQLSSFVRCL